ARGRCDHPRVKRSATERAEPTDRRGAGTAVSVRTTNAGDDAGAALVAPVAARERNRADTTARILAAVGEVLARDGFGALGVNAVAKHAGVDKVLIYRYFGGMSQLLKAWGESGRFWPGVDEL